MKINDIDLKLLIASSTQYNNVCASSHTYFRKKNEKAFFNLEYIGENIECLFHVAMNKFINVLPMSRV